METNPQPTGGSHAEKLRGILSKYYTLEIFQEDPYLFEPTCVIVVKLGSPPTNFDAMQAEMRDVGYFVKFHTLNKDGLKKYKLAEDPQKNRYEVQFEAKIPKPEQDARRKTRIKRIQVGLLIATLGTIGLSAYYYLFYMDGYYGGFTCDPSTNIASASLFTMGMLLIVVIHEYGHIWLSRKHHMKISAPYLIPGPPPIGMFGAFVSMRDEPQTRNQQFDTALGGILIGFMAAMILTFIGLALSVQVDTATYLNLRADYFAQPVADQAKFVSEHLNTYNLLFLLMRSTLFETPASGIFYGYTLPTKMLLLHPLAYAGWIGLVLAGLNLIPIPFFDGGHVLKAILPGLGAKVLGGLIGATIFIIINPQLWSFTIIPQILLCCVMYSNLQVTLSRNRDEVLNPTIPFTKSRKIIALIVVLLFVVLCPLNYLTMIFGFGA